MATGFNLKGGLVAAIALGVAFACLSLGTNVLDNPGNSGSDKKAASDITLATVNGHDITERDLQPLLASGLDRANAVDRLINRQVAATLGQKEYGKDVSAAIDAAERDIAANIYANLKMKELLSGVTESDIQQRYTAVVKDADFNAYKLTFALFPTPEEANAAKAAYKAGKPEVIALFKPVVADAKGGAMFISRNDVPYNLGVFVAKLKQGEFTEPALVRNGNIVLYAQDVKTNPKPELATVKESLRTAIADERLAKLLSDARKAALVALH